MLLSAREGEAGSTGSNTLAAIQRELQALSEAKALNEAALRDAIARKQQRKADIGGSPVRAAAAGNGPLTGQARLAWERAIIEDELSKPLEVDEEFIRELTAKEADTETKLLSGLSKHHDALHALRLKLLDKEMIAEKNYAYKAAREALGPRPSTLEEYHAQLGSGSAAAAATPSAATQTASDARSVGTNGTRMSPSRRSQRSGTHTAALSAFTAAESHVLDSLSRLEDLESRIAELEAKTSGADLAELLGISLPDAGTGSSAAYPTNDNLRSAYAPMPLVSASTRKSGRSLSPTGHLNAAKSVFSNASGSRMTGATGGGGMPFPSVGFAPALGVVYTKKRLPPESGQPAKTVYTVEKVEDATVKRGFTGPGYRYDADSDPRATADRQSAMLGDTGGSAEHGRSSSYLPLDGDDAVLLGRNSIGPGAGAGVGSSAASVGGGSGTSAAGGGGVSVNVPALPIETSAAIDRWLAQKQKQIANSVQARAAEASLRNSFLEQKAAVNGRTGAAAAAAAQRGRRAAPAAAPNARMAQSMGPTASNAATRGRQPVARSGQAAADFKRNAAKTVAVGNNISKVLQAERARQAAKGPAGRPGAAAGNNRTQGAGQVAAQRTAARTSTNRATLREFQDIRKKFENQKAAVRGTVAGTGSRPGAGTTGAPKPAALPGRPGQPGSSPVRGRPGAGAAAGPVGGARATSNPRGAGSSASANGNNMRSPGPANRSTSNGGAGAAAARGRAPAAGAGVAAARAAGAARPGALQGSGPGRPSMASPVRGRPSAAPSSTLPRQPVPQAAPRLGVLGPNAHANIAMSRTVGPVAAAGSRAPAAAASASVRLPVMGSTTATRSTAAPRTVQPAAQSSTMPRKPLGGATVQQARANFASSGVRMPTLAQGRR